MVNVQKKIPNKLGSKSKLDVPLKSKKKQIKKENCDTLKNIDKKLIEGPIIQSKVGNVSPVKETAPAKVGASNKSAPKEIETIVKNLTLSFLQKLLAQHLPPKQFKKKNEKAVPTVLQVDGKVRKLQKNTIKKVIAKKAKKTKMELYGPKFKMVPYDEEQFNAIVTLENISKITAALKTEVEEVATKKFTIFMDYQYLLQVDSCKMANCKKRIVKINLQHPLVDKDDDVLLVVPDIKGDGKVDYKPTVYHWEDLLRNHGVDGITVMTVNQIRTEYRSLTLKKQLFASYKHFLCDRRIIGLVIALIGRNSLKARHTLHAVRLHEEQHIKQEIEISLRRTAYKQGHMAALQTIPVGTHKFTSQQVAENILLVVSQLKRYFPAGLGNVRNLFLKIGIAGISSLPLYIKSAEEPEQTPTVDGPHERSMINLKREDNNALTEEEGKLPRTAAKRKPNLQEMKATLKEEETVSAKKLRKDEVKVGPTAKKNKELELPEIEQGDDDSSDDDAVEPASGSDKEENYSDEMGQQDEVDTDAQSVSEIGLDDKESEAKDDDDEVVKLGLGVKKLF